jgi:hypothetical protein
MVRQRSAAGRDQRSAYQKYSQLPWHGLAPCFVPTRWRSAASTSEHAIVVVRAGQKAPAIEGAVPADGAPLLLPCCRERRYRHIPFERQLWDARSVMILHQVREAAEDSSASIDIISA